MPCVATANLHFAIVFLRLTQDDFSSPICGVKALCMTTMIVEGEHTAWSATGFGCKDHLHILIVDTCYYLIISSRLMANIC